MRSHCRGFLVLDSIKLMAVLVMSVSASVLGVQYSNDIAIDARVPTQAKALLVDLITARNLAIKDNQRVVICARDGTGANVKCDATRQWRDGWMIIAVGAGNRSNPYRFDAVVDDLLAQSPLIEGTALHALMKTDYIEYNPAGSLHQNRGDLFQICGRDGQKSSRMIRALQQGKVKVQKTVACE